MEPSALALFGAALLINAGAPGPSVVALVARVVAKGWRDVAPFVAAMWIGEVAWLTAALFGLSALADHYAAAFTVLKYLGLGYLLFLASQMWREAGVASPESLPERQSPFAMFMAGMAVTLGNPKIMVFYLALLPTLIDITQASPTLWAVLAGLCVAIFAVTDGIWIIFAHKARDLLRTPRALQIAGRVGAGALCCAAVAIAIS